MLELKTKKQLADEAFKLSHSLHLVRYRSTTYIPADFETLDSSVSPDIDRTIWMPLTRDDIRKLGAAHFDTLFGSDGELASFDFMVSQTANQIEKEITSLLVRTKQGLMELDETGTLVPATHEFRPNTLMPMLNEDQAEKDRVFAVISEWVDSDEEAHSLLHHLATSLAPGWSAVKYVLLLGEGRNGKSLFMKMVQRLYGDKAITDAPQPTFKGHDPAVISYNFIGKKVVTFNDVGDPSTAFLEWMKRMITGNLEVKTPSGAWLSIPCNANFLMETNHRPQVLDIEAHRRRFVVREFDPDFRLREHLDEQMLDAIGERGDVTAADIVVYLLQVKPAIEDWTYFEDRAPELPEPTGMEDF